MKLIVGLGNPGKDYEKTRHNCGYMAIDFYANKNCLTFKKKFNSLYSEYTVNGEKLIIVKPETFMNLSGNAVIKFSNFYNIEPKDILIIYDDISFDTGKFKIKRNGSAGGHNGIKNIIACLHTEEFPRVKIGTTKNDKDLINYVLEKFSKEDMNKLNNIFPIVSDIIDDFSKYDVDKLMDKYNGLNNGL